MKKKKVGIIGGAGYVGGEVIRLLLHHDNCDINLVSSRSQSGKPVSIVHSDLKGWTDLIFEDVYEIDSDIIFICMGHGKSKAFLEKAKINHNTMIIDLSRDYRLKANAHDFIYGLTELNKAEIKKSRRIANPGCFATCVQLGLLPLAASQLIKNEIHITAITGSTGAGQNPVHTTHNSWRNNNISVYKAFEHQHLSEIYQSLEQLQNNFDQQVNFIPMRGSFTRGIFASMYLNLDSKLSEIKELYKKFYNNSSFVHLSENSISVKDVVNTNNCFIHLSKYENKIRIESCIDNLLKGAAGQAIQNMNVAMGWEEKTGLKLKASAF